MIEVHIFGAFLAFFGLFVYCSFQAFLSHKLSFALHSTFKMLSFRIFLTIMCGVFLTMSKIDFHLKIKYENILFNAFELAGVFSLIASNKFNGANFIKWLPTDGVNSFKL